MARVLLIVGLAVALFLLIRWASRQPPRVFWQGFAIVLALFLLVLVLTGRAHWLTALVAAVLPFLRGIIAVLGGLPLLKRVLAGMGGARPAAQPSSGQTSTVQSRYLRMVLDHDSGDLNGEVLEGRFAGRALDQLSLDQLLELLRECSGDEESVALLQAYLERTHGDSWRSRAGAEDHAQAPGGTDGMTREEALQILGLEPGAGEAEIVEAHRRLMQKLHPDRGGSAYLAARINLAKDTLLGKPDIR